MIFAYVRNAPLSGGRSYCLPDRSGDLSQLDRLADFHPLGLSALQPPEGFFYDFKHLDLLSTAVSFAVFLINSINILYVCRVFKR